MSDQVKKKVRKDKFNNSWYDPGASKAKIIVWYFVNAIFFISYLNPLIRLKVFLLRLFGAKIGKRLYIKPGVNIKYPWKLKVGDYVSIGENVWIDNLDHVELGDQTTISQGAMLVTGNHNFSKESFDLMIKPIILEEGCWIGAKAIVCPGITCHSHSILTAGSVANKNLEAYTIYSGHPAQAVKDRVIL